MMSDSNTNPPAKSNHERRQHQRFPTMISVDYSDGENFLFSYIHNISEMGIFIRSEQPLPVGTELELKFGSEEHARLHLHGEVSWINPIREEGDNPNPGMGVRFRELTPQQREQVVHLVKTVAYIRGTN